MPQQLQLVIFVLAMTALVVCGCIFTRKPKNTSGEARGGRGLGKIAKLTPPNGWRAGLVCRVLSAEPVLRRPIYQTLFERGVGAALVAAQRRSLQTPRRILSLRGTRT